MRNLLFALAGTLLATGCIFPSFDDMQGGKAAKSVDEGNEPAAAEVASSSVDAGVGTTADASATPANNDPSPAAADASADVTAPQTSATAGTVTCGASECVLSQKRYCCADYLPPDETACRDEFAPSPDGCAAGGGHALLCDEKADCPGSQVCCHKAVGIGFGAMCVTSCNDGKILCKTDADCPNGRKCNGGAVASGVPNKVCGP